MEVPGSAIPEKRGVGNGIHFEPGIHHLKESELNIVYKNFYSGDLNSHDWNEEVSERIASYASNAPALILSIDGLEPQPPSAYPLYTSLQEASYTWVSLPARPNRLNATGKVYVMKGDSDYYRLPQAILPKVNEPINQQQRMDTIYKSEVENADMIIKGTIFGETASIAGIGTILWAANKFMNTATTKQHVSRRAFLDKVIKLATGTTALGSLLRGFVPDSAALTPNEQLEEFLQTVDSIVRPRLVRSTFVDGRTALLLTKAEDAQAVLSELRHAENVVVMGAAHADMAATYRQNKEERNNAIVAYAKELLDVAKQVCGTYYHISSEQIPQQVSNLLFDYVTQVDIVEVVDPGGSSFQPEIAGAIDKQVTLYKSFRSPQVEGAIKHLRP